MAAGQEEATAFTALLEGSRLESCYEIFVNGGIKNVDAFKGLSKEKIDALGLKPIQQQKVAKALHELEVCSLSTGIPRVGSSSDP